MSQELGPVMRRFREQVIQECAVWLNEHVLAIIYQSSEPDDGHRAARINAISFAVNDMKRALLSGTDQPEASKTSQRVSPSSTKGSGWVAPADHGPETDVDGEAGTFTLCERTVDRAIVTVSKCSAQARDTEWDEGFNAAKHKIILALEALLPKDRAKDLVKKWPGSSGYHPNGLRSFEDFARWLITNNHVKEG